MNNLNLAERTRRHFISSGLRVEPGGYRRPSARESRPQPASRLRAQTGAQPNSSISHQPIPRLSPPAQQSTTSLAHVSRCSGTAP